MNQSLVVRRGLAPSDTLALKDLSAGLTPSRTVGALLPPTYSPYKTYRPDQYPASRAGGSSAVRRGLAPSDTLALKDLSAGLTPSRTVGALLPPTYSPYKTYRPDQYPVSRAQTLHSEYPMVRCKGKTLISLPSVSLCRRRAWHAKTTNKQA